MNKYTQPAYPVMPLQDNFQRLVVPVPGISKLELFALEIFKCYMVNNTDGTDDVTELMYTSTDQAEKFLKILDAMSDGLNKEKNEKDNGLAIFDR